MNPTPHSSEHAAPADMPGTGGTAQTPAAALIERALLDDPDAAVEVVRRLAGGDTPLFHAVSQTGNTNAGRLRATLLHFLAYGDWQGGPTSLPTGYHAGHGGQHLRDLIAGAVCTEGAPAWQATLLDALRDPGPAVRQMGALLIAGCHKPAVVAALIATLNDRDEGVRWAAALALVNGDQAAVVAVLRRLAAQEVAPEMRHVTAYMLRQLTDLAVRQVVAPVVQALDSTEYRIAVPLAAGAALKRFSAQ